MCLTQFVSTLATSFASSSQELAPILFRLYSQIGVQNVTEILKPFSGHPGELVN